MKAQRTSKLTQADVDSHKNEISKRTNQYAFYIDMSLRCGLFIPIFLITAVVFGLTELKLAITISAIIIFLILLSRHIFIIWEDNDKYYDFSFSSLKYLISAILGAFIKSWF